MSSEAPSGHQVPNMTDPSTFDELADLFLGDDTIPERTPTADRAVNVNVLIVGHLPVIAAPWISQHARDVSRASQSPVAVLSRSGDRTTLDLFNTPELSEQHTIEGAIDQAISAGCSRWLIRTDAVSELSAREHERVDAVTLLTGADDAAVVGAYRAIKGLVADGSELDEHAVGINLAVMGSESQKARGAAEKIRKAVRSFLQAGLADVSLSEKVSAGGASVRTFDNSSELGLDELLSMIPRELSSRNSDSDISGNSMKVSLRLARDLLDAEPSPARTVERATSRPAPSSSHESVTHTPAETEPTDRDPVSASRVGPMDSASRSHASLIGLTSIEARCPYADEIEIAADHEGRAHLIATTEGQDIARSIESLQIAHAWLSAHVSLLSAATGGKIRANPPLESSSHLIVEHAASARRLLDSEMSVYVLARGNQETLCVPLN
ncbi:MAG: hypothetical protein Phyf2KO_08030 [Phycisphaerales bacterium]